MRASSTRQLHGTNPRRLLPHLPQVYVCTLSARPFFYPQLTHTASPQPLSGASSRTCCARYKFPPSLPIGRRAFFAMTATPRARSERRLSCTSARRARVSTQRARHAFRRHQTRRPTRVRQVPCLQMPTPARHQQTPTPARHQLTPTQVLRQQMSTPVSCQQMLTPVPNPIHGRAI